MLGVFGGSDHIDGEAVFASRGEYIDTAGFHGGPGFVRMPASPVEGARRTKSARPRPQAKCLVISREKNLPLHFGRDFFCITTSTFEQDGIVI